MYDKISVGASLLNQAQAIAFIACLQVHTMTLTLLYLRHAHMRLGRMRNRHNYSNIAIVSEGSMEDCYAMHLQQQPISGTGHRSKVWQKCDDFWNKRARDEPRIATINLYWRIRRCCECKHKLCSIAVLQKQKTHNFSPFHRNGKLSKDENSGNCMGPIGRFFIIVYCVEDDDASLIFFCHMHSNEWKRAESDWRMLAHLWNVRDIPSSVLLRRKGEKIVQISSWQFYLAAFACLCTAVTVTVFRCAQCECKLSASHVD